MAMSYFLQATALTTRQAATIGNQIERKKKGGKRKREKEENEEGSRVISHRSSPHISF